MSLTHYTPPSGNDLQSLIQVSQMLAKSSLVPSAYRNKPENILLVSMAGQPHGWNPVESVQNFHVIDGTPSIKPMLMAALVRQAGHSIVIKHSSPELVVLVGKRRDTGDTDTVSYSIDDAKRANLLGRGNWKTYPEDMLMARAISRLCRRLFQDVTLAAGYTPEELGATETEAPHATNVVETVEVAPVEDAHIPTLVSQREAKWAAYSIYIDHGFEKEEAKERAAAVWTAVGLDDLATIEYLDDAQYEALLTGAKDDAEKIGPSVELVAVIEEDEEVL